MINIANYKIKENVYSDENILIYRGYAQTDKSPVIIKTLNLNYSELEVNKKLKHEYRMAKQLDIDGCLKDYKLIECDGRLILVIENFNGYLLKEFIENEKMDLIDLLTIAVQLSTLLGDIHKLGIIHNDVKPSNIMIDKDTKKVRIIDFSICEQFSSKNDISNIHNKLYKTLEYISPEQTGRMNRKVDYRTDYYSLGIILYEIIAGKPPFSGDDPMEIIHSHIAKMPVPLHLINNKVPLAVSDIVMKLLSKNPEERYQSSHGIVFDLKICIKQLNEIKKIDHIVLGQNDLINKLEIPDKLYNREKEISRLIDAFEKVVNGKKEIMFISGTSGTGKTMLINNMSKYIHGKKGYYISGKFDQLNKDIPYLPFIQAFRQLISQVLTESEERIEVWRNKLLKAFDINGQIITDIIPEVEFIIGKQPQIQSLPALETKNRFNTIIKSFINVFANKNNPLVIFLDDLQWAAKDTIDLITSIAKDTNIKYLFIICAYRNDEIKSYNHPLIELTDAEEQVVNISSIVLSELNTGHIAELISDVFNSDKKKSKLLAEIIYKKTYGNPFFVNQFIKLLYTKKLVEFNFRSMHWDWDIDKIKELAVTDNVVELLIDKIKDFSASTQELLKLGSCIGNKFDVEILSKIYGKCKFKICTDLLNAVRSGMIETGKSFYMYLEHYGSTSENDLIKEPITFKFSHDYIQEATYSMIGEKSKEEIHYNIGIMLLGNKTDDQIEENIFEIINHLKIGRKFIVKQEEKNKLAELNLIAGKKAKFSASYEYALKYFTFGIDLLSPDSWQIQYELTFNLYLERAECEYLNIKYKEAEQFFETILENVKSDIEKARVYKIKIILYINQDKAEEAVKIGIKALNVLGVKLSIECSYIKILLEFIKIKFYFRGKKIEDLLSLPYMKDQYKIAIIDILMSLTPVAYIINQKLFILVVLKIINLSLRYGNSYASVFGYGVYALLIGSVFGNYENGYKFGKLSLILGDKINNQEVKSKYNYNFGWFISHWRVHARDNIAYLEKGFQEGLSSGDLVFAAYCCTSIAVTMYLKGDKLDRIYEETEKYFDFVKQIKYEYIAYIFEIIEYALLSLKNKDVVNLKDNNFYKPEFEEKISKCNIDAVKALYYIVKMQLLYINGENLEVIKLAEKSQMYLNGALGVLYSTDYYFYYSLAITSLYNSLSSKDKSKYLKILKKNQKKMKKWSDNCQENFLHKYLIVEAEIAHIKENDERAAILYNHAIQSAYKNEYLQNAAIGNELAAKFYFNKKMDFVAETYIKRSIDLYVKWGADVKAEKLCNRYYSIHELTISKETNYIKNSKDISSNLISINKDFLDLNTIMKASYTISKELVLENILENLMKIGIENAGAQKGLLFIDSEGMYKLKAEGIVNGDAVNVYLRNSDQIDIDIPLTIINYVARTRENLILDDVEKETKFINDSYIQKNNPRSVLCIPIMNKGDLFGILYLENNSATNAFTYERIKVLNLLASQTAISIENASMYRKIKALNNNLEVKIKERTKELYYINEQLKEEIEERKRIDVEKEKLLKQLDNNNKLLKKIATTDSLTGLYNHKYILEMLSEKVKQSRKCLNKLSIIMLDIDYFKKINDKYGHQVGDEVIVKVASILKGTVKKQSMIGRYGGEEFLIVLPNTDFDNAYKIAENIRNKIMSCIWLDGKLKVTISGGVSTLQNEDSFSLVKKADELLYRAKQNGRNRIEL